MLKQKTFRGKTESSVAWISESKPDKYELVPSSKWTNKE